MKNSNEKMIRFYRELGKLFYAVSTSDNTISTEEAVTLKKIVQEEWLMIDATFNPFGTDSAYQIEIVFDWLLENKLDTNEIFADFKSFKADNKSLFTLKMNELILKTAEAIAQAFSGKNRNEHDVMNPLEKILNA